MFADGFHPKVRGGKWLRARTVGNGKCHDSVEEMDQGAATLVADLAEVFEKVQLKLVCAWAMRTRSRKRFHGVLCGYFSTSEG